MKKTLKVLLLILSVLVLLVTTASIIAVSKQDSLVQSLVESLNKDFKGRIVIEGSHISPFKTFPYISIDLEDVSLFENKSDTSEQLLHVSDVYVGFDFWTVLNGSYEVKAIKLDSGFLKLVQHRDGSFNVVNAMSSNSTSPSSEESSELNLNLKSIQLDKIDLIKLNEETNILIEAFIENAQSSLKSSNNHSFISLDSRFVFNLIADNDTSFLHHKHVDLHTQLDFDQNKNTLLISPSEVVIERALFLMNGSLDIDNDMDLDLKFSGNKPDFDLFLAFTPDEITPILRRYENGGRIYFDASVKGKSINGFNPAIDINFGCAEAFVSNTSVDKEVNELFFKGHFTNGEKRDPSTMALTIEDFTAKPEAGNFKGDISIVNFDSPDIEMQLDSEFDLDFLAKFLNLQNLKDVTGKISLSMNFHDIIDLDSPEKTIEKLNEAYAAEFKVENLNFSSSDYPLPAKDINIEAVMDGHQVEIKQFEAKLGKSDIAIKASLSDLPAIIHHTNIPVEMILDIHSDVLDIAELTQFVTDSTGFNEKITDLSLGFKFKSSAKAFTESPNLPIGEFFIDSLNAQLNNYPHRLHDFHADIYVNEDNFKVIDFSGMIDESDFHFDGLLSNYDIWFDAVPVGHTQLEFDMKSNLLQLEDLFAYGGENYVPEDYRHEEFKNLLVKGLADFNFEKKLKSTQVKINDISANMKVHPMRFEKFGGTFFMDSTLVKVENLGGRLGQSEFKSNYIYHRRDTTGKSNLFTLTADKLNFDEIFSYNPPPVTQTSTPEDHEASFNIFEVPFSNMDFSFKIDRLQYHKYDIANFNLNGRMQPNHYLYLDTMSLEAAGGEFNLKGYFNGSDPELIYFSPNLEVRNVDLDKLLLKFENFGQDHLVSENLHGRLSGTMEGKVHVYPDLIPIIDDSEIHLDFRVVDGSLNDYPAFEALSSYFTDKNLSNVRFDTLQNKLDLQNGKLMIPAMNINSTLGYFELSGEQDVDLSMEYYLRVPWKVVTRAGAQKLFGKKNQDNSDQVDEIQYRDENKRTRFLNLKIQGTPDDYKISLGKDKG